MRTFFASFFAVLWLGLSAFPVKSQAPANTLQCLNALRERASAQGKDTTIDARVVQALGLGEAAYTNRQFGFREDGRIYIQNILGVGPENPSRLMVARVVIDERTAEVWLTDHNYNLISAIWIAGGKVHARTIADPAVRTGLAEQMGRLAIVTRERGFCS